MLKCKWHRQFCHIRRHGHRQVTLILPVTRSEVRAWSPLTALMLLFLTVSFPRSTSVASLMASILLTLVLLGPSPPLAVTNGKTPFPCLLSLMLSQSASGKTLSLQHGR